MKLSVFLRHIRDAAAQSGLPDAEVFRRVRVAGVSAVEVDLHDLDTEGDSLLSALRSAGFTVSGVYGFYDLTGGDFAPAKHHVDAAIDAGASEVMLIPGFLSEEDAAVLAPLQNDYPALSAAMDTNETVRTLVRGLNEAVRYAAGRIHVTLEDFDRATAPYSTTNELRYLLERVPGLELTLDCGNFSFCNEDLLGAVRLFSPRIAHVHTKDRGEEPEALARRLRFSRGQAPVAAGAGYVPLAEAIRTLRAGGYDGWFVIEHFGSDDTLRDMLASAAFLRSLE